MFTRFVIVCFAALLGGPGGALAQTGAASAGPNAGPMSRAELRQCLQMQVALEGDKEALARARAQQDATIKSLDADEAKLKAAQAKLERSNRRAVKAFDAQVKAHHERVAAHNQTLPAFNAQAAAYEASEARYQARCAGRPYREADRAAVQP